MAWTIRGESGMGWDAGYHSPEELGLTSCQVTAWSLEGSKFVATRKVGALDLSGWPVPVQGQEVTVKNGGSVRFKGWITKVRPVIGDALSPRIEIEACAHWYWMRKAPISSTIQAQGFKASATRPGLEIPSGTSIYDAFGLVLACYAGNRPNARAVITYGNGPSGYSLPKITLTSTDCLSALAELLRWVPDAVAYLVPSDSAVTHDAYLFVMRRGSLTVKTFTVGTDKIAFAEFDAMPEHENAQGVIIDYASIINDQSSSTGKPEYKSQASSGATIGAPRIVVSGPEQDTYLPATGIASSIIQSRSLKREDWITGDAGLSGISGLLGATSYWSSISSYAVKSAKTGQTLTGYPYLWLAGDKADWWDKLGVSFGYEDAVLTASLRLADSSATASIGWYNVNSAMGTYQKITNYSAGYAQFTTYNFTSIHLGIIDLFNQNTRIDNVATGTGLYQAATRYWWTYQASFSARMANENWPTGKTYYKPSDYQFSQPPSGLANGLAGAMNFTPWTGRIQTLHDETLIGYKVRVAGGPAEWAAMEAMVLDQTFDLSTGKVTTACGILPRMEGLGVAQKVGMNGKTNFSYT